MDFHSIQFYLRHFSLKHLFSWYSLHRLLLIVEQINKHTEFHWIKVYPMGLYAAIFSISLSLFRIFLLLLLMLNALLSNIWWFCLIIQLYLWSFYHLLNCEKCYQYSVIPKMADANGCGLCFSALAMKWTWFFEWFNLMFQKCRCETVAI